MAEDPLRKEALRLVNAVEAREGLARFIFTGGCMFPVLQDEDLILVKPVHPNSLRLGDIVVYKARGHRWVHRFLYRKPMGERLGIVAKPDNAWSADPPFFKEDLEGIVQEARRNKKSLLFTPPFSRACSCIIGFLSLGELFFHTIFIRLRKAFGGKIKLPHALKKLVRFLIKSPKNIIVHLIAK